MTNNNYLKIKSKPKYFIFLCLYYFMYPLCHILYGRKNNWLICERGDDAQDNGYFFFKYLRDNHPEINAVYLIKKSSPDYNRVSSIGKAVEYGSFKHFLMMIGYPVKISSQLFGYSPWIQSTIYYRRHKTRHKHIFLQHGITKNDVPGFYYEVCKSLDLFVCGAKPEYEYIKNAFGYQNDTIQYLGFPRFDNLHSYESNNHILVMPTWRRYLSRLTNEEFLNTEFYREWSKFLNNEELIALCKKKGIEVDLYLHHELQPYSSLFKKSEVVNITKSGEKDVQSLLKESSLLITDFSSVYFDFAYMNKPMIFFQFDEDKYNKEHYAKGYFDYRRDGFGDVCLNVTSVVKSITEVFNNQFNMDKKYLDRTTRFFTLDKNHNCDRVFESIVSL